MSNINQDDLAKCLNILNSIFGDAKIIFEWLYFPHPSLNGRKPLDVITDGEADKVVSVLKKMSDIQPS
jgi:uncharacterized protein (DUF2384 family)